jgi:uncharacterized protein YjiK
MKLNLIIFVIFLIPFSCNSVTKEIHHSDDFPYNLNAPDHIYKLNSELEEISALTYLESGKLACVQDEDGMLYTFDTQEGEIADKYKFGKHGDYEGIEVIKNTAYVLRSDGTLYEIMNFSSGNTSKVNVYETPLEARNDTEGLGFDPSKNCLLIACKEQGFVGKKADHKRSVYQFDLENKAFIPSPYLVIDEEELSANNDKKVTFHPSGISIHPQTRELYIIASNGSLLVVVDVNGNTVAIKSLPANIFNQPEGICFAPDGTLYISNEGKGGKGNILRFQYKRDVE